MRASWRPLAAALAFSIAAAAFLAMRSRPMLAVDDAAITFRYAERVAGGKGLTYNDHERVLGTSSPLHAIVLAPPIAMGLDAERAALFLGIATYVAAIALVVLLAGRAAGVVGGFAAGLFLLGDIHFRFQVLGGLEIGLAAVLGLSVVWLTSVGAMAAAGVMAGLAVVTKLDALALVAAVVITKAVSDRRIQWQFLAAMAAIAGPWLIYAAVTYGSPVPQSLATKLSGGEGHALDPLWMSRIVFDPVRPYTWLGVLGIALGIHDARSRVVTGIVAGWAVLHAVAYSLMNLGAPYPWYTAMPLPLLALAAGVAVSWVVEALRTGQRRWSVVPVAALAILVLWSSVTSLRVALPPRAPQGWELFEADRRAAGLFLREHARPGEVLECAYGWPAFISRLPVNDVARLNSSRFFEPVAYRVEHGDPSRGAPVPAAPHGMVPLATFDSARRRFPEYGAFVVFGAPTSAAASAPRRD